MTLSGQITNPDGVAVDYATVLLKSASDTLKVYGGISDEQGRFILKVPAGDYLFQTSFLGYSPLSKQITLVSSQDMGNLVMTPVSTELDAVVVRARMVKREADRFDVVNVGNSPVAAGQTAKEMLDLSPTVWIDEEEEFRSMAKRMSGLCE
ncbi:MAG: carboxypeptidase regulatory-like domain-containing protein [Alistipes indistinctus]